MSDAAPKPARWKPIALLFAVFVLGGVAGAGIARAYTLSDLRSSIGPPTPELRARFRLDAMRRHLDLTSEQQARIEALLGAAEEERERLLDDCAPALDALRAKLDADVAEVLTPEQRARFDELGKHRRGPPPRGRRPPRD